MADHHEIRKLSVDGSNYTILKQVRDGHCFTDKVSKNLCVGWGVDRVEYEMSLRLTNTWNCKNRSPVHNLAN